MFDIILKNGKSFSCDSVTTIFEAAKKAGINLDHSCLNARCRSCIVKILVGETINNQEELVLTEEQKKQKFVLSCNAKPLSDLELDIEDLGEIRIFEKKIIPSKISIIEKLTEEVIKVVLRLPPNSNFNFNSGQYVNIIKGNITRSYSIASSSEYKNQLEFFIKKYKNGLMSEYFFKEAKINDLLRLEGPIGSFFLRDSNCEHIVFLATGTGIAPIKSILESVMKQPSNISKKEFWVFVGARYEEDLLWKPNVINENIKLNYVPVLSRQKKDWNGENGYVQNALLKQNINLENTQVYACGSNEMIQSSKKLLFENSLCENNFFSDVFVPTN